VVQTSARATVAQFNGAARSRIVCFAFASQPWWAVKRGRGARYSGSEWRLPRRQAELARRPALIALRGQFRQRERR
jgi:hypothetical protein